jgi:general secretion pathway protein K
MSATCRRVSRRRRDRGVALIAALLVVALAVVLIAALLDRGEAVRARSRNTLRAEQGWQLMRGLEGWAAAALRQDWEQSATVDSREDVWAQPLPPLELPEAKIEGRLIELGGCFNLNALRPAGQEDARVVARFERLLRVLKLEPTIAAQVRDWIDPDADPNSGGAEDLALQLRRPPYRAANRPFAHVSELRLLPAVSARAYAVLRPHVCALPADAPLNLNTASVELWMSLADDIGQTQAQRLARDGRARYRDLEAVQREFEALGLAPLPPDASLGVGSSWFVLEAQIRSDGIPFAYWSLLQREPDGIRVTARSRGRF